MKKNHLTKQIPVMPLGLIAAAIPWGVAAIPDGLTVIGAGCAGVGSALAAAVTAAAVICNLHRERREEQQLRNRCAEICESIRPAAEGEEQPDSAEAWLERINALQAEEREKCLNKEKAEQSFILQWNQKLQERFNSVGFAAQKINGTDNHTALAIARECMAINCLSEQILQYFDCAEGNIVCHRKKTDLYTVVSDAVVRNAALFSQRHIGLRRSVSHLYADTDAIMLGGILDRLLDQAARQTKENGTIGLSCREQEGEIALTVEDAGTGLSAEELTHVFDRDYVSHLDAPGTVNANYFTVRSYAELLGHGLEIRSEEGKGTRVTLRLKKESAPQPENTASDEE